MNEKTTRELYFIIKDLHQSFIEEGKELIRLKLKEEMNKKRAGEDHSEDFIVETLELLKKIKSIEFIRDNIPYYK